LANAGPLDVGVNTMSFMWTTPAREALKLLARKGYTRFEVMAQHPHFDPWMRREDAQAFGRFLREAGLTVETINIPSLDQNLASGTPQMRDYTVHLFEQLIGVAEVIGARAVIVVTGRVNPLIAPPRADLEGWFAQAFERLLPAAERSGVQLLLENIPMGAHPRADQLIAFAARINHPLVNICYDIANAHFIGEDPSAGLRQVRARLGMVHLSDTGGQAWRHDPVGEGTCDFAGFAQTLREIGYDQTSMLELVCASPLQRIVESHRKIAAWGWAPLHA
jgi:L-ribulose-5-phosphate 3-epimerase